MAHMEMPDITNEPLQTLTSPAKQGCSFGIDFARLNRDRAAFGLTQDGPEWTATLDEHALSRLVLGLE